MANTRAVVFAYHDVGVRCLQVLLSAGVEVPLVVTTKDDPNETQWFASTSVTAADYGLTVVTPDDVNTPELEQTVAELRPDFVFSFYFRSMIGATLLNAARLGALNIHGSMLPALPRPRAGQLGDPAWRAGDRGHSPLYECPRGCRRYRRSARGAHPRE